MTLEGSYVLMILHNGPRFYLDEQDSGQKEEGEVIVSKVENSWTIHFHDPKCTEE